ncbi:extracellular solute-binding protein [Cohnella rhizosphaerae]|uniref:Extracellular solute-binding protein n=1 Tax=Cohnella rhizosphaerae TaxID=1457232 RepID=A0A9X4QXX8_9BACL|nr:extracellular solute-binding protein [Cohnella rhizosphaerae]MDG0814032.1 extracellular solute-binding protein [Cohnella rhizosphaerae]
MVRLKKSLTALSALTLTVAALSACGSNNDANANAAASGSSSDSPSSSSSAPSSSAEPVQFSFYFTGSQNVKDLWDTLIPMFEKQNDKVKVKEVYIPSGAGAEPTYDRILAAKKAGKGSGDIDLYEDGINVVAQGTKDDVWAALDTSGIPNLANIDPKTMTDVSNMAVPYRSSAVVLAYDSAKVSAPPKTLDELLDWIKQNPGQFAYNDPSTGGSGSSFVTTVLYDGLSEDDIHNSDPAVMAKWDAGFNKLKELNKFVYGKGIYPKKNQGTLDLLANGEVEIIPAWSDMVLQQLGEKLLPDTVKMQQITPGFNGGPTYLMVNKLSDKQDAVKQFLDFVLSPEAQEVIVTKMNGFPGIELSNMSQAMQDKFKGVSEGFRTFNIGDLGTEINKRWQSDVAAQ